MSITPNLLGSLIKIAYLDMLNAKRPLLPDLTSSALYYRTQLVITNVDTSALLNAYPIHNDNSVVLEGEVEGVHSCTFLTRVSNMDGLGIDVETPESGYETVLAGAFPVNRVDQTIILEGISSMVEAQCIVLAVQYNVPNNTKLAVVLDLSSLKLYKPACIMCRVFRCFIITDADVKVGSTHILQVPSLQEKSHV